MATKAPSKRASSRIPGDKAAALDSVFTEMKALLAKHAPPFEVRTDEWGGYHLWKTKPMVVHGRKRKEIYFAGVIPRKDYVGFYYMPIYAEVQVKEMFKPELLSLLKGRSCFHLKNQDAVVMKQIKQAVADGVKIYKREGWV